MILLHILHAWLYQLADGSGIAHVAIVYIASCHPVVGFVGEVECSEEDVALQLLVVAFLHIVGHTVVHGLSEIATQTDAQTRDGVVVDTGRKAILVGCLKLERLRGTRLDPVERTELIGIESCEELGFVAEVAMTSPHRNSRLVPGTRQDSVLAFRTVYGEEVEGFVISIGQTYRHYDVSGTDVEELAK